jgi:phospholipase C
MVLAFIVVFLAWKVSQCTSGAEPKKSADANSPDNDIPVRHFIYIIQENITYDHYFGTYPGGNGIPAGTKLAYLPGGRPEVAPFNLHATSIPHDLNHSWQAAHLAYDGVRSFGCTKIMTSAAHL